MLIQHRRECILLVQTMPSYITHSRVCDDRIFFFFFVIFFLQWTNSLKQPKTIGFHVNINQIHLILPPKEERKRRNTHTQIEVGAIAHSFSHLVNFSFLVTTIIGLLLKKNRKKNKCMIVKKMRPLVETNSKDRHSDTHIVTCSLPCFRWTHFEANEDFTQIDTTWWKRVNSGKKRGKTRKEE